MAHLRSLRDYITALEEIGEIQRIGTEVDWNLEIGAIIRRSYDLRAPAPLFTNITGYSSSGRQIIEAVAAARARPGIPPVSVPADSAPCKQNIARGADINLYRFPTPLIHGNDGGRYIQTYGINMVATPDGSWTNWSVNRMTIAGRDRLACLIPQSGLQLSARRPVRQRRPSRQRRPQPRLAREDRTARPRQLACLRLPVSGEHREG